MSLLSILLGTVFGSLLSWLLVTSLGGHWWPGTIALAFLAACLGSWWAGHNRRNY